MRRATRWRRAGVVVGLVALGPSRGVAQTEARAQASAQVQSSHRPFAAPLFAPRPTVVDYARHYTRTEDCLAAVARVRDSAQWGTAGTTFDPTQWQAVLAALDPRQPEPAVVGQTALRCAARFPVATLRDTVELALLQELAYAAPDSVLDALLARRLALVSPDSAIEDPKQPQLGKQNVRANLLKQAIGFAFHAARPVRLAWAERLLGELERLGPRALWQRAMGYSNFMRFARTVADTTMFDRYLAATVAASDSFLVSLPQTEEVTRYRRLMQKNVQQYKRERGLVRGDAEPEPQTLVDARAIAAEQGRSLTAADSARAVAIVAPPIEATFWFRRSDSTTPRPGRGTLSLVLFVEHADWCMVGCDYRGAYAVLKALSARFGQALEITLVTHTHGFFRNYPPPTPAEEADYLRRYFFEHLQLPGALAVEVTHVPQAPGRRSVRRPPANLMRYQAANLLPAGYAQAEGQEETRQKAEVRDPRGFLLDRDGRMLLRTELQGNEHELLSAVIASQLARVTSKS